MDNEMKKENIIDEYLVYMTENGASDLHMSTGEEPAVRIDGDIQRFGREGESKLEEEYLKEMIYEMMDEEQIEYFERKGDYDFSYALDGVGRFRVNVFQQNRGIGTIMRLIPERVLTMKELGMETMTFGENDKNIFRELANAPRGLVLVTGPTGSGKSTTLAAMIDYINKNKKSHVLTVEDPIEFVHTPDQAIFNQREVHRDTESFNDALRAALRQDPDAILVGEMRDLETIKLAITAAETGHIVFGTLHTNSATKTIDRIIDVFPGDEKPMIRSMLSESLIGVVSQALLKKKGGGRVAAHEIMIATPAIKNLIREDKVAQMYSMLQTGSKFGMQTLDQSLEELVANAIIEKEEAYKKAFEKDRFK
jgi:twitching motility protein PilT